MNCDSLDLKAYILGETDRREKAGYETHITHCDGCREELDRLRLTHTALLALPDEEIPQRIAFVSDRVFEPRWWQSIWRSGPVMGFASAALLSCAILVHGFARPVPVAGPAPATAVAQVDNGQVERRIQAEVKKAVAELEVRDQVRTAQAIEAAEKKFEFQRSADLVAARETIRMYQQQMGRLMVAYNSGGSQ